MAAWSWATSALDLCALSQVRIGGACALVRLLLRVGGGCAPPDPKTYESESGPQGSPDPKTLCHVVVCRSNLLSTDTPLRSVLSTTQ